MKNNWLVNSLALVSVVVGGTLAYAENHIQRADDYEMRRCEGGGNGIATQGGWLDPFFSDNEVLYLDTVLQDISIHQSGVSGFSSAPLVTVTVPPSTASIGGMVITSAGFFSPEQDGWSCMDPRSPVRVTDDGRLVTTPFNEAEIELATWNGSSLDWNDRYDVRFLLIKIRCKYENCSPSYSGGFHIGMRIREKL